MQGPASYSADPSSIPFMGGIFSGVVLAYMVVCELLAIYMCFVSVPEGGSTYVFLEPRGLIVANGLISMGCSYGVDTLFARYDHV